MDKPDPIHHVEALEPREMFSNAPLATFMNYVKGTGGSRTFAVLYDGPAPILRGSIGADDVFVTSSNESYFTAVPVGIARAKAGSPTLVRYRVDGLKGTGTFTIHVRAGAVADTTG